MIKNTLDLVVLLLPLPLVALYHYVPANTGLIFLAVPDPTSFHCKPVTAKNIFNKEDPSDVH
jgi:hypothetical protein